MEAGLICDSPELIENQQLKKELEDASIKPHVVALKDVAIKVGIQPSFDQPGINLDDVNGFLCRGLGLTSLNKSFFRFDVLYSLEHRGKVLINSAQATERALNKCQTSVILDASGIPTPRTVIAESLNHAIKGFKTLGEDVLVKPIYGSQGRGIFRLDNQGYAERHFLEMFQSGYVYYLQEFHDWRCPPGLDVKNPFDVRLFVLSGEVIGAMIRESTAPSDWLTNITAGATPRFFKPDDELTGLAVKSASALGLDIAGIDLMYSGKTDSWTVLEVNCSPGWKGLSQVCETNIPKAIVDFFKSKMKQ